MKQTAVEKMFQYFIEQKNNGVSHWCINDLLGQLQQAKEMEKEQIAKALIRGHNDCGVFTMQSECDEYYNETFKSE